MPIALLQAFPKVYFADYGRDNMAVFQVEIVPWAIEVCEHGGYKIGAVLAVVGVAHANAGNLGQGVGLVGRLQGPGQKGLFLHGLLGQLGVDATGAQEQELFYSIFIRCMDIYTLHG